MRLWEQDKLESIKLLRSEIHCPNSGECVRIWSFNSDRIASAIRVNTGKKVNTQLWIPCLWPAYWYCSEHILLLFKHTKFLLLCVFVDWSLSYYATSWAKTMKQTVVARLLQIIIFAQIHQSYIWISYFEFDDPFVRYMYGTTINHVDACPELMHSHRHSRQLHGKTHS